MTTMTKKVEAKATVRDVINSFIVKLNGEFKEREDVVRGLFLAILTGQHVLLLGPAGTGKSLIARCAGIGLGGRWFETLLTRFSTPEQVFGPVSLKALEQDRFERKLNGTLAECEFGFLDEIFKANAAILNALLTAINERLFHNGSGPVKLPLRTVFGASNELPEGKDLEALFDRFVLRFDVPYIRRDDNLRAMLGAKAPEPTSVLTLADLDAAQAEVRAVKVTDATVDALLSLRSALKAEGFTVSDRRWRAILSLCQANAWLEGEAETSPEDLMIAIDAVWRVPTERAKVAKIVGTVADPVSEKAGETLESARETATRIAGLATGDRDAYLDAATKGLKEVKLMLRKLTELEAGASARSTRTISDVRTEVQALHDDLARVISKGLGLRS